MSAPDLRLKAGRERSLKRRHPWVFSGAVEEIVGNPRSGETVRVCGADGKFLAWAAYSPASQIRARVWSFDEADVPGPKLFDRRVDAALARRRAQVSGETTNAMRLVHGESDGLPGLIADRYDDALVVQFLSAGCEEWRDALIEILRKRTGCARIYERSDTDARELEGQPARSGWILGSAAAPLRMVEHGIEYEVDPAGGQKTGFFLDQRDNRMLARQVAGDRRVLNAFAYTGAFAVYSGAGGARRVVSVESSPRALALARRNWDLNGLAPSMAEFVEADVSRHLRETDASFDLLILDPPALVKRRHEVARGARAYKDLHLWAFRRAAPGAYVLTFSCSQHLPADLFWKIVHGAAVDVHRDVQVLRQLGAGADHPTSLAHSGGEYLKGLLLHVRE